MLKIEETETYGWKAAIRGMRNPKNSWDKSDSDYRTILCAKCDDCKSFKNNQWEDCDNCSVSKMCNSNKGFMVGPNDLDLMTRLCNAGTDHRKFMRMIVVYCDITAPLYWWKEFDTYKVGTVENSCSTMHKIHTKEFTLDDFSYDHLICTALLENVINELNIYRDIYNNYEKQTDEYKAEFSKKDIWWQMIQLLPSSYNQKRTVMLNYEVLNNIYTSRRNHKLDEWHDFCDWAKTLPYSKLITGRADISDDFWEITRSCFAPMNKDEIARAILTGEQMPEKKVVYKDALSEK